MKCEGVRRHLKDAVEISIRVSDGQIHVGCPFLQNGICVAENDQQITAVHRGRILATGANSQDVECIHGDGQYAEQVIT